MSNKTISLNQGSIAGNIASWVFGIIVLAIGLVNAFWGNDSLFGVMIVGLSFVYYPPINVLFKKITGHSIPLVVKIVLGLLIIWVALGVGELLDKVDMMLRDLGV